MPKAISSRIYISFVKLRTVRGRHGSVGLKRVGRSPCPLLLSSASHLKLSSGRIPVISCHCMRTPGGVSLKRSLRLRSKSARDTASSRTIGTSKACMLIEDLLAST
jgi:hypothetical protein